MTPDVVVVKALAGYQLETEFANGERRLFDLRPYLDYPAFAPLAEDSLYEGACGAGHRCLDRRDRHIAGHPLSADRVSKQHRPVHGGAHRQLSDPRIPRRYATSPPRCFNWSTPATRRPGSVSIDVWWRCSTARNWAASNSTAAGYSLVATAALIGPDADEDGTIDLQDNCPTAAK
jgi:hypothetical protein